MKSGDETGMEWRRGAARRLFFHLLAGYVLAMMVLNGITDDPWLHVLGGSEYASLRIGFWILMQTMVLLVELVTQTLDRHQRPGGTLLRERYLLQVLCGIEGVGLLIYLCTFLLWKSLSGDVIKIAYPQYIGIFELLALIITNMVSMFLAGSGRFLKSGASPRREYLDTLLLKNGSEQVKKRVDDLAYMYADPGSKKRWAQPFNKDEPKMGGVPPIDYLSDHLDPDVFFHVGRGLIVHCRGVERVIRAGRRRKIWLNPPLKERSAKGEMEEIAFFIPKRQAKVFDDWQKSCKARGGQF